jgi:flavin reductase (DIM6/NTAB) family NADH-FMN oxidoreductase RutF
MFYEPKDGHGLPHNPFNAIVAPRPIGWIASRGSMGDNLAPYSFFNAVAYVPPQVIFSSTGVKDSLKNIRETGVFSANIVGWDQRDMMNATSGPYARGEDEFALANVPKAECKTIDCPRVAISPATLECKVIDIHALRGEINHLVLAEVTGVHIRPDCLVDGMLDVTRFGLVTRLGYKDYSVIRDVFQMTRPGEA